MKLPPTVSLIVARFDRLKQLRDQADRLRELNDRLQTHVSAPLSSHIRLATIRDGCMVIHADSSSWAAQLRYKTPELLATLADDPEFEPIRTGNNPVDIASQPPIPLDQCDPRVADAQRPLGRVVTGAIIDDEEFVDRRVLG